MSKPDATRNHDPAAQPDRQPRTYVTEIGYPPAGNGALHSLHRPMPRPEPLPEPGPDVTVFGPSDSPIPCTPSVSTVTWAQLWRDADAALASYSAPGPEPRHDALQAQVEAEVYAADLAEIEPECEAEP
jgi:hypothetical protein